MFGIRFFGNHVGKKVGFRSYFREIITFGIIISMIACGQTIAKSTATAAIPAVTLQPGESQRTVVVNGVARTYILHIPPGLDKSRPTSVVFVFHGFDPETHFAVTDIENISGFNDIANKNGFLVVYPYGISGSWNAGKCCGAAAQTNVDDIAFVRQMLSDLSTIATLDSKRIFATGLSYGAMFSYRLACEMSDTFAAIAPLAGVLVFDPCQPHQAVSIMHIHGLKDTAVPFTGGMGGLASGSIEFPSVQQGIDIWVKLDGCKPTPRVSKKDLLTQIAYSSCRTGTSVELYTHDALGNAWPSQYVFPAAQMIWDFFRAHPKQ